MDKVYRIIWISSLTIDVIADLHNVFGSEDSEYLNETKDNDLEENSRHLAKRESGSLMELQIDKIAALTEGNGMKNMISFIFLSKLFITLGYIVSAILYSAGLPFLKPFGYLISPLEATLNIFRFMNVFLFCLAGLAIKTTLSVGMSNTMKTFMDYNPANMIDFVTKDKFIRDAIGRGLLNGMFQVIGFTLFALALNKDVLTIGTIEDNN